jgi:hypothetical protein
MKIRIVQNVCKWVEDTYEFNLDTAQQAELLAHLKEDDRDIDQLTESDLFDLNYELTDIVATEDGEWIEDEITSVEVVELPHAE